jgi:hypothetical protein
MATNGMLPDNIRLQALRTLQTDVADHATNNTLSKARPVSAIPIVEQQKVTLEKTEETEKPTPISVPVSDVVLRPLPGSQSFPPASAPVRSRVVQMPTRAMQPSFSFGTLLKGVLFTAVAALILAGAGYGIVRIANDRSKQAPVQPSQEQLSVELVPYTHVLSLFFDSSVTSDREALATKIGAEAKASGEGVTFYQSSIPLKYLLATLSPSMPSEYQRSLEEKAFFGGSSQGNFLILKFDSYDLVYAGMLQWEKTMQKDLFPLFGISSEREMKGFEDRIVSNRDTRVAVDRKGNLLFMYGFYGDHTMIFAQNEEVFKTVYDMLYRENL